MNKPGNTQPRQNERIEFDPAVKRRIVAAYLCDEQPTISDLRRRFRCTAETLKKVITAAGVPIRHSQGRPWA